MFYFERYIAAYDTYLVPEAFKSLHSHSSTNHYTILWRPWPSSNSPKYVEEIVLYYGV